MALLVMPWARLDGPSIQAGLLKAVAEREGHAVDVHYLTLALADRLGPARYDALARLSQARSAMLGDWLFTRAAFGEHARPVDDLLAAFPDTLEPLARAGETAASLDDLQRTGLPDALDAWAEAIDWHRYDLVGFTSTFDQNVACIAMAQRVKRARPELPVVVGGANVEGVMGEEHLRCIGAIDYIVTGEGDRALPALLDAIAAGTDPTAVPGLLRRVAGEVVAAVPAQRLTTLSGSPVPDYSDYVAALEAYGRDRMLRGARVWLPFESSRGCWWGEHHQCTFCGLNGTGIAYRSRPPEEVVAELVALAERYECLTMRATDNVIDHAGMEELCRLLAASGYDFEIFYEVRAHLGRAQLEALHRAGVRALQPGIESLSTPVLSLMDKGTTALMNLRTLKWAHALRMQVLWGVITGFPGQGPDDDAAQARLMPLLHHLPPPQSCAPLSLERFSPSFERPDPSFTDVRPREGYRFAYPLPGVRLERIAYAFDYAASGTGPPEGTAALAEACRDWQQAWARRSGPPILVGLRGPGWLRIIDTRGGSTRKTTLRGLPAQVLAAIGDTFHSAPAVARMLGGGVTADDVQAALDSLCDDGFAVADGGHAFSLVLPAPRAGA